MTPERLEGMRIRAQHGFDKNEYMPFGPGDVLELIAEIQRLQAELPTPAKEPSGELEKAFSEAADFAIIVLQEVCYHFNGLEQQGVEWAKDNALWIRADGALKALNVPMRAYRAQVTKEGDEHVS